MTQKSGNEVHALDPSASIDRVIARTLDAGETLRNFSHERVIRVVADAAARLADPQSALGAEARTMIPVRTGLSVENVEKGLMIALGTLRENLLANAIVSFESAHRGRTTVPVRLAGFVLAEDNVFTAALAPLVWSLLMRVPAVLQPAASDAGLAELFSVALAERDVEVADAVALLRFARSEDVIRAAITSRCDVVHAWGSDRVIAEMRSAMPSATALVPHRKGLGAAFVPRGSATEAVAHKLALDVALHDQLAPFSPHFVLVERGGQVSAATLARLLSERSLKSLSTTIPRSALPAHLGPMQLQWRSVGASRGELFEGDGWAVSYEAGAPLRLSPGYRNIAVHEVENMAELGARLSSFGEHLNALGVAGPLDVRWNVARALPTGLAPRVSEVGVMASSGLIASSHGQPPWHGFVRLLDVD